MDKPHSHPQTSGALPDPQRDEPMADREKSERPAKRTERKEKKRKEGNSGFDDSTSKPRFTLWYRFILGFGKIFVLPIVYRMLRVEVEKPPKKIKDPSLIAFSHGSNFDQFAVIRGVPPYKRYIASDALLRKRGMRVAFHLINNFIYRRKGEKGDNVVKSAVATTQKGIHVAMAPEGGETLNGVTNRPRPRTGEMVKRMDCGLVTFQIVGNYFMKPPWGVTHSKEGKIFGRTVGIYSREEIRKLSEEEINDLIYRDLYINQYDWQREHMIPYDREGRAEFMEYVLYICPKCGEIGHLHSKGNTLSCECGYTVDVDVYGFFQGEDLAFDNLYDWDVWQRTQAEERMKEWIKEPDKPFYTDVHGQFKVLEGNDEVVIDPDATLEMAPNFIRVHGEVHDMTFPFDEIRSVSVAHRHDVVIIYENKYYQFTTEIPTSPQKYKTAAYLLRGRDKMSF